MKMKKLIRLTAYLTATVALIFAVVACSETDEWAPGPKPAENNPGVYFDRNTPFIAEMDVDGNLNLIQDYYSVTLKRDQFKTSQSLRVPIIIKYADSRLIVPDFINFEAGEETAELKIELKSFELSVPYGLSLEIDEKYANPYLSGGDDTGPSKIDMKIQVVAALGTATFEPGEYSGTNKPKFVPFKHKIYINQDGSYTIKNFLFNNAGYNFDFNIDENNNIRPLESCGWHDNTELRWYFYSAPGDASANRIPCYIPGQDPADNVTYIYFYIAENPSSYTAFWMNKTTRTGKMMGYSRYTKSSSGRIAFKISW